MFAIRRAIRSTSKSNNVVDSLRSCQEFCRGLWYFYKKINRLILCTVIHCQLSRSHLLESSMAAKNFGRNGLKIRHVYLFFCDYAIIVLYFFSFKSIYYLLVYVVGRVRYDFFPQKSQTRHFARRKQSNYIKCGFICLKIIYENNWP